MNQYHYFPSLTALRRRRKNANAPSAIGISVKKEGSGAGEVVSRLSVEKTSPAPLLGVVPRTPSPGPCRASEIVAAPPDRTLKDVLGIVIAKTSYSLLAAPLPTFNPSDTALSKDVRSSPPLS